MITIDSELHEYKESPLKLSEVFKKGSKAPPGSSVFKALVTVLKKDVNFAVM